MVDAPEILPCPFCGEAAKVVEYYGRYDRADFCVHCRECDLSLDGDSTPEAAIARWNKRDVNEATEPLLAEIERLKERDVAWGEAHAAWTEGQQAAREATAALLAEIAVKDTAIDTRDAYIGDLAARITERDATIADLRAQLARLTSGPVTAADVQRARERVSPRFGETILPAMTIPDDGRVDAGWPGADGGRDGA